MSCVLNMLFGWEEVLVTQDIDAYMKMKAELNDAGIRSKTEFVNLSSSRSGMGISGPRTMYYLYTKKGRND